MTPYGEIYKAFLTKIEEDEWAGWEKEFIEADLKTILEGAIVYFKFPRISLIDRTEEGFNSDLSNEEIQVLATYMKVEWLNRAIMTWENVRPQYDEQDFSQANLINNFIKKLAQEQEKAQKLEARYYRSINEKPFPYRKLAGG